jgi:hypothetical protein
LGCSHRVFYRAVRQRKVGGKGEGGSDGGTSIAPITGDGNREGEAMGCDCIRRGGGRGWRRGDSTVPVVDDIVNSSTVAGETEGGGWRLEVEDDKRKLGRWAECAVWLNC